MHCLETFVKARHCTKRATLFRNNVPSVAYVARAFHGLVPSYQNHDTIATRKFRAYRVPLTIRDARKNGSVSVVSHVTLRRIIFLQLHCGRDFSDITRTLQCRTISFVLKLIFANRSSDGNINRTVSLLFLYYTSTNVQLIINLN